METARIQHLENIVSQLTERIKALEDKIAKLSAPGYSDYNCSSLSYDERKYLERQVEKQREYERLNPEKDQTCM
jgi:hypothetical protein